MARVNVKTAETTHEGGIAAAMDDVTALRRSVMACLLWEDTFYESGVDIASRIVTLARRVPPHVVAAMAVEAREDMNLRHVPLLLMSVLAETTSGTGLVSHTLPRVIQRADELAEFLAIHAKRFGDKPLKRTISAQIKKGLARAFNNFDAYQLAKYDRAGPIRLRDVAFLCHVKGANALAEVNIARLVNRDHYPDKTKSAGYPVAERIGSAFAPLETPDTWETNLSGGADKKETFERLIRERKLGYLALLRNLRNMEEAGCDRDLVEGAILARKGGAERVLPFRFLAAAREVPSFESALNVAMLDSTADLPVLDGNTAVIVDNSSSMSNLLSKRSKVRRVDAAATLAGIIRAAGVRVFAFGHTWAEVPWRPGLAQVDAVTAADVGHATNIAPVVKAVNRMGFTRIIVISDEQIADHLPAAEAEHAYVINVASYAKGIAYDVGGWTRLNGWSDSVLRYMTEMEAA